MPDYKNTLNLPHTDFPMKANLAQREPEILQKWIAQDLYGAIRKTFTGKSKFILHAGPPYANGHIHLGTATTTVLKDIIVKIKTLSGYDAPYVPGWDCHGLPIELNVEKKVGKPGRKLTHAEFRVACREYANNFVDIQREEFKRLGIIADWQHPYLTMDYSYEANIIRSLAKIIKNDYVQKGYKPVHWCLDCASALAEAEVEYADKNSPSIDVRFKVIDQLDFWERFAHVHKGMGPISVAIWTTTPWTLPANEAVALNAELEYVLVTCPGPEQLLVAESLLPSVLERYQIKEHTILGRARGEKLAGLKLKHPFYDKEVPIILGAHVTTEAGTGAVHTAPAHGLEDYAAARNYHLPVENPVGDDGCYIASTPLFAGLHVSKANDAVINVLKEQGTLIQQSTVRHPFPHCWRHKTPLIFRATPQWFISMDQPGVFGDLRARSLETINQVEWIPDWGKARIEGMMENRPDWCISRQRAWGVPIPLFVHKETGHLHPETLTLLATIADLVEKQGVEAWFNLDAQTLLGEDARHYQKISDVLDVWFDSGVSHECVLKVRPELHFPADIVLEGSDQHRGWFNSSLLTSVAINNEKSFKQVLTHGFVVDGEGRKMSKSLGNVIAPEEVIRSLGADILRLWVASVDYRNEINASKEILSRMSESYRRVRNTMRFLLANLAGFNPQQDLLNPDEMLKLDRWAVDSVRLLQEEILQAYDAYQFHLGMQKLHQFCVSDLGGFYLDIIKDRQYTMQTNSRGRRSAQTALYHIAHSLVRLMAPVLSFTAEEIWQYLPGTNVASVFLTTWYEDLAALPQEESMNANYWQQIRIVREIVNKEIENQRNNGQIGSALEAEVYLYCDEKWQNVLNALGTELRFVLITSLADVQSIEKATDALTTDIPGLKLKVKATEALKCERCWQRREDVNADLNYPGLCGRCVLNVAGEGEIRNYA